ncbi:MAG TPA: PadR family transcriptional regulator [Vicinamibacterales bacterium]|jgi:PadR family transcriptional regulator PadR|nr:PadR family transcriptional regulator [Vicinamibacterales bacterium]
MTRRLLTDFEIMILLAILRVGDDAYGVTIAREIEATAGRTVQLPAVYTALDRLETQGLVRSRLGEATPQRGGRAKKHFALTKPGLESVHDTRAALTALWSQLPQLS